MKIISVRLIGRQFQNERLGRWCGARLGYIHVATSAVRVQGGSDGHSVHGAPQQDWGGRVRVVRAQVQGRADRHSVRTHARQHDQQS